MSSEYIASINMKNIQAFAENFLANPNKHVEWLADSGNRNRISRTSFLLIVLQAMLVPTEVLDKKVNLCQVCLPALKNEWCHIQPKDVCVGDEQGTGLGTGSSHMGSQPDDGAVDGNVDGNDRDNCSGDIDGDNNYAAM